MDYQRAEEIFYSPKTFEVLYEGASIWIENLNPQDQSAHITSSNLPKLEKTVNVKDLSEGNQKH